MILPANDVADAEIDVIGTRGEVVCGHAVGAQQREIFDVIGSLDLLAVDRVIEPNLLMSAPRNPETQRERLSGRCATVAFLP